MSPTPSSPAHDESAAYAEIVRRIDPRGRVTGVETLTGGVSAQTLLLHVDDGGATGRKLVLRRHGPVDLAANPNVAAMEFRLLRRLHALGMAVPKPLAVDNSGTLLPTPYVVLAYVEGRPVFGPTLQGSHLRQVADQLAAIHRVAGADLAPLLVPRLSGRVRRLLLNPPVQLDDTLSEGAIRAVLTPHRLSLDTGDVLLHGDYWPGNFLWRAGRLVGVIDWEDAMRGDPLADVANARLELLWACGVDAMHRFTRRYLATAHTNARRLPLWDLWAALRPAAKLSSWGLADAVKAEMRDKHRWFVAHALDRLAEG